MIIMSHFARNNTVGAGIRRESRARSTGLIMLDAVARLYRGATWAHVVFFVRSLLFLLPPPSLSLSRYLSPFNGTCFLHSRDRLHVLYVYFSIFVEDLLLEFLIDY